MNEEVYDIGKSIYDVGSEIVNSVDGVYDTGNPYTKVLSIFLTFFKRRPPGI